ncbi:LacI family DNA-binding transcriptional regulator [Desertihabitans aurantiacus]|uniref:LacI family DNA-binding transcriptional regulator n=1 Tax=Desertihabitans aurantiacus TaxID=2282477 RepID=UPI000DF7F54C|nr:LacI family DNA-binding transcriptional regulator [Desertihabitans aurantiacus]
MNSSAPPVVDTSRPTMVDVARRAGVSPKTVSNVVNGYAHVSEGTRERVVAAMAELNYRANLSARNLKSGRTGVVALAVPWLSNPYFADLAGHVIRAAEAESVTVLIDETRSEPERERRLLDGTGSHLLDGVIISPQALTADDLAQLRGREPMVLLGERIFDGGVDHVAADNEAAAQELTEHLIATGRRRVATIGFSGTRLTGTPQLRRAGVQHAVEQAGLAWDEQLHLAVEGFQRRDGAEAMRALLALPERPDAVVCFNDVVALGALKALAEARVDVPGEIAVAGFDNIEGSDYAVPSLTTVDWDNAQLAEIAIELLLDRIHSRRPLRAREIVVRHRVVSRESTGG